MKNHKGHGGHIIPQPSDGLLTCRLAQAMQGENKQSVSSNLVLLSILEYLIGCPPGLRCLTRPVGLTSVRAGWERFGF